MDDLQGNKKAHRMMRWARRARRKEGVYYQKRRCHQSCLQAVLLNHQ
jgi:hypothetical protein